MEGDVQDKVITMKLAHLDPLFAFLGLSAEPVIEYVDALRAICAPQTLIAVGYTGAVAAYLPTSKMLAEGGLEVDSPGYSLENASYRENVSELVIERIRQLLLAIPPKTETV